MHHHLGEWPINLALFLVYSNEAAHISIGAGPLNPPPLPSRQSRSPDSRPVIGGATRGGIHVARAFYTRGSSHYASFFRLDCPFWTGNSLPRPAVPLLSAHCAPSLCLASRVDYWSSGVSVPGLDSSSLAVCLLVCSAFSLPFRSVDGWIVRWKNRWTEGCLDR